MSERILFVGITDELTENIIDALTRLGHTCEFFNQRGGLVFRYPVVRKALRAIPALKPIRIWGISHMNRELLTTAARFKPSILLVWNGEKIHPETIQAIHDQGAITANWFLDFMTHWPSIKRIAPIYDFFFSPDRCVIDALQKIGVHAHQASLGCRPLFTYFPEDPRPYPVTFIGSYGSHAWTKREEFLTAIHDSGLHIWGPPTWQQTSLKQYYRGTAHGEDMLNKYRQSKIAIDVPWDHMDADAISLRPFEVTAAGACLFFYDMRPEMRRMYEPEKEYIPFTTNDELRTKLQYYLSHPAALKTVARAGYERFMQNHTYEHRLAGIIATIRSQK